MSLTDAQLLLTPGIVLPLWFFKNIIFKNQITGRCLIVSLVCYALLPLIWAIVAVIFLLYPGGHPPLAPLVALAGVALSFLFTVLAILFAIAALVKAKAFSWLLLDIILTNLAIFILLLYLVKFR